MTINIVRIDEDKTLIREQKTNAVIASDNVALIEYEKRKQKALQQLDKDNKIEELTSQVAQLTKLVNSLLEKQHGDR